MAMLRRGNRTTAVPRHRGPHQSGAGAPGRRVRGPGHSSDRGRRRRRSTSCARGQY